MKRLLIVLLVVLAMAFTVACDSEKSDGNKGGSDNDEKDYGDYKKILEVDEDDEECKVGLKKYVKAILNDDFETWYSLETVEGKIPEIDESDFADAKEESKYWASVLVGNVSYGTQEEIDSLQVGIGGDDGGLLSFTELQIQADKLAYIPVKILEAYGEDIICNARMVRVDGNWYFIDLAGGWEIDEASVKAKNEKYNKERTSSKKVANLFVESLNNKDFGLFNTLYDKEMFFNGYGLDELELVEEFWLMLNRVEEIGELVEKEIATSKDEASAELLSVYSEYEEKGYSVDEVAIYIYEASFREDYEHNNVVGIAVVKRNGEYMVCSTGYTKR